MIVIVYCIFGRTRSVACQRKPNVNRSSFVVRCSLFVVVSLFFFFFFFVQQHSFVFPPVGGEGARLFSPDREKSELKPIPSSFFFVGMCGPSPRPPGVERYGIWMCMSASFFFLHRHTFFRVVVRG